MGSSGTLAETYFIPARPQFWKWSGKENSEIECAWLGTPLLIFRKELTIILKDLQPHGWPELAPILLVCLATRDNWTNSRKWLQRRLATSPSVSSEYIETLLTTLDRIQNLPADLRTSTEAKSSLIRITFEQTPPRISPEQATECLNFLERILPHSDAETLELPTYRESDGEHFVQQTRTLKTGVERLTPESIRSLMRTSLEQELLPAQVEIPDEPVTFRERLASWLTDPQLFGMARIATQLLSLLKWTQPLRQPDNSPQGGVSDISNRGPLDRLLLSELAQDDDTLAVRLALNEALFLKREASSATPPYRRAVLVDTSLRMWGVPRIYAASAALAFAAAQDTDQQLSVSVEMLDRNEIREADVATHAGCLDLLSALSPILNPADLITEWIQEGLRNDEHIEPLLVTCSTTFELPDFQNGLSQITGDYFVAIVEGNGAFELRHHSSHGWKTVKELKLDLEDLLKPHRDSSPLKITPRRDDYVPAILRTDPFPLRLPFPLLHRQFWTVSDHKVLSFASGNRLLYWDRRDLGPLLVGTGLPDGEVEAWCTVPDYLPPPLERPAAPELSHAVIASHTWNLITVDLQHKTTQIIPLVTNDPPTRRPRPHVLVVPECLFFIHPSHIDAFSLTKGVKVATLSTSQYGELNFHGNRYLASPGKTWYRLSFDGVIHLVPVANSQGADFVVAGTGPSEPLLLPKMYNQQAIGVHRVPDFGRSNGRIFWQFDSYVIAGEKSLFQQTQPVLPHARNPELTGIWDLSFLSRWELKKFFATDLESLHRNLAFPHIHLRKNLRTKFTAICVGSNGVFLKSNRQKWWRIHFDNNHLKLVLNEKPDDSSQIINFQKYDAGSRPNAFLGGTLPNGNSVRLDPRGLLHLIPANTHSPEMTLVLDENRISGWIDDGSRFGDPYYVEALGPSIPHVWHQLLAPFFGVRT